ncbi:hypothetical protein [Methanoplanus limicola]|uniref:Uncharacterized protein n=1 Tax=Methanoplanus limicola DSM 2279 TaxID=937775 RepID=H1Z0K0_9EURY|nr:hypothetical protein [Methanoplanus limicola]EHQ35257.1 hypothetical protein Metlim_1146 [Methanoplanus limicola DSM 2279]
MFHFGLSENSGFLKPMDHNDLLEHDEYPSGYHTSIYQDYSSSMKYGSKEIRMMVLERDEAD